MSSADSDAIFKRKHNLSQAELSKLCVSDDGAVLCVCVCVLFLLRAIDVINESATF